MGAGRPVLESITVSDFKKSSTLSFGATKRRLSFVTIASRS